MDVLFVFVHFRRQPQNGKLSIFKSVPFRHLFLKMSVNMWHVFHCSLRSGHTIGGKKQGHEAGTGPFMSTVYQARLQQQVNNAFYWFISILWWGKFEAALHVKRHQKFGSLCLCFMTNTNQLNLMQNLSLQQNFFIKMGNVTRGELALQHDPTSSPRHVPVKGPLVCADFLLVLCR